MRLTVSCAAFNNIKYTKMFLASIKTSNEHEVFVVDNGSTDGTSEFLKESGINHISYKENRGFSYAYNDAMDHALKDDGDLLLFCGNDTVLDSNAIDHFVRALDESDLEMFSGNEIIDKAVLEVNEGALEAMKHKVSFVLPSYDYLHYTGNSGMNHSCLIRRKSVFDKIGYYDVNFYPAYFEDNDYNRRCGLAGIDCGLVHSAQFLHYWSRSIYEGGLASLNSVRFNINRSYYREKWGGGVGNESFKLPFGNSKLSINDRAYEIKVLQGLGIVK